MGSEEGWQGLSLMGETCWERGWGELQMERKARWPQKMGQEGKLLLLLLQSLKNEGEAR